MNAVVEDLKRVREVGVRDAAPLSSAPQLEFVDQASTDDTVVRARAIVESAEAGDAGAPFTAEALDVWRRLQSTNLPEWMRMRKRLKDADIGITALDRSLRGNTGVEPDDESLADRLVAMARDQCEFVRDENGEPYALLDSVGARQVLHVEGKAFGEWLSHAYYRMSERAPSETALRTALSALKGAAKFDGEQRDIHVRAAVHDGAYWLDLCDDEWRCVRIDRHGWRVCAAGSAPLFTRSSSMRALPVPVRGGSMDALWSVVNVPEADRLMLLAWLLECLRPDTPYPPLELVGEHGSAKSSTQEFLRQLFDPNQANLRAAPKSVEDVFIQARNAHVVSMENVSHLSAAYQDALCILATGGGFSARTLYTNAEETVFELRKPIMINGIAVVVTAQDLLDRCVHLDLPPVERRRTEQELKNEFARAQPRLVGALLDLFVRALAELPNVEIGPSELPRMADFAKLGEAVYRASGRKPREFMQRYTAMRTEGVHRTIEASPVGSAIGALVDQRTTWSGTVKGLLDALAPFKPHGEAWPHSAKGLADALRRLTPALQLIGIGVAQEGRGRDGYTVSIKKTDRGAVYTRTASTGEVHDVHNVHRQAASREPDERREHGSIPPVSRKEGAPERDEGTSSTLGAVAEDAQVL
jgi:hypothetical protein